MIYLAWVSHEIALFNHRLSRHEKGTFRKDFSPLFRSFKFSEENYLVPVVLKCSETFVSSAI